MHDPFFIPPIPWLQRATAPVAEVLSLPSLPYHIHEVLVGSLVYGIIYYPLSPAISRLFFSSHYNKLSRARRLNWDAHVVSLVQSCLINALALWVMFTDEERKTMGWQERVWGYTSACGMVQGLATGYFLWDLIVTSRNMDVFGFGTLAHAISALAVYSLGFRPFLNYYACNFILWELSTPFLNIHWFLDKLGMTGSSIQLYNGFLLISTFFSCRLVYGTYQSYLVFKDVWSAVGAHPDLTYFVDKEVSAHTMKFATENSSVPFWLAVAYLASNITLNSLNSYWFYKMIQALHKRFQVTSTEPQGEAKMPGKSTALKDTVSQSRLRHVTSVKSEPELDVVI
ncbi:hypothetical protein jhhlp_006466 [Lomentospora prolificans]|uniref:TLC domain-containing protein n=1 Tax=Lomentospora prolificans TaxID=41688 RepID=A0A2N3N603_9PEZI|nr:hypothetical protein jhhlp_006466 [Lomentospora prolificans]